MVKITDIDKINLYYDRKSEMSLASFSSKYNINTAKIQYLIKNNFLFCNNELTWSI